MIESIDLTTAPGAREKLGNTINAITSTQREIISLVTPAWQTGLNPNSQKITMLQSQFRELVQARDNLVGPFEGLTDQERFELAQAQIKTEAGDPLTYNAVNEALKSQQSRRTIFTDPKRQVAIIDDMPIPFQTPAEFAAFETVVSIPVYDLNTAGLALMAWRSNGGNQYRLGTRKPISAIDIVTTLRKRLIRVGVSPEDLRLGKNHIVLDRDKYQRFVDREVLDDHTKRRLALTKK